MSKPIFVFGSNDYYAPRVKNPFSYLRKDDGIRKFGNDKFFICKCYFINIVSRNFRTNICNACNGSAIIIMLPGFPYNIGKINKTHEAIINSN